VTATSNLTSIKCSGQDPFSSLHCRTLANLRLRGKLVLLAVTGLGTKHRNGGQGLSVVCRWGRWLRRV